MAARHVIHVISNTHWDREWLFPFQETRMMLVDFLDGLLNVLETQPEYRAFVLGWQTMLPEGNLKVRPTVAPIAPTGNSAAVVSKGNGG